LPKKAPLSETPVIPIITRKKADERARKPSEADRVATQTAVQPQDGLKGAQALPDRAEYHLLNLDRHSDFVQKISKERRARTRHRRKVFDQALDSFRRSSIRGNLREKLRGKIGEADVKSGGMKAQ
jgi:hypothetical protein